VTFHSLTVGNLGISIRADTTATAYDDPGQVNRLLLAASQQPDLCGLKLEEVPIVRTGGYSYLHRPVPLYDPGGPQRTSGFFNYMLTTNRRGLSGDVVASEAGLTLLRLTPGPCQTDPDFAWRLPGTQGVNLKPQ